MYAFLEVFAIIYCDLKRRASVSLFEVGNTKAKLQSCIR